MWIICLADNSHEMSSLIFYIKKKTFLNIIYCKDKDYEDSDNMKFND